MKSEIRTQHQKWTSVFLILCCTVSLASCVRFSKQKPGETPDISAPRQSFYSAPLERLNSGAINIATGPLEIIYQTKEEIKRTDPIYGFIPGIVKGVTWGLIREVVGVFEVLTFFAPWKPHLKLFDTEWIQA